MTTIIIWFLFLFINVFTKSLSWSVRKPKSFLKTAYKAIINEATRWYVVISMSGIFGWFAIALMLPLELMEICTNIDVLTHKNRYL